MEDNAPHRVTDAETPEGADALARVTATPAAVQLLNDIRADHGDVMFHQSGGCCDGSAPMCYPLGEFRTGANDV